MISRAKGHASHFDDEFTAVEAICRTIVVVVGGVHVLGRRGLVDLDVATTEMLFVLGFAELVAISIVDTDKSFARGSTIAAKANLDKEIFRSISV